MTNIVCYMGGSCGDLIAAIFDTTGCVFRNSAVGIPSERTKLKKPHLFASESDKDLYLESCKDFPSIVSHDPEYHLKNKHKFITVSIDNYKDAIWAAKRFKHLHKPRVWTEMTSASGADSVEKYAQMMIDYSSWLAPHAHKVVHLSAILNGELFAALGDCVTVTKQKTNFYHNWLGLQYLPFKRSWHLLRKGIAI